MSTLINQNDHILPAVGPPVRAGSNYLMFGTYKTNNILNNLLLMLKLVAMGVGYSFDISERMYAAFLYMQILDMCIICGKLGKKNKHVCWQSHLSSNPYGRSWTSHDRPCLHWGQLPLDAGSCMNFANVYIEVFWYPLRKTQGVYWTD